MTCFPGSCGSWGKGLSERYWAQNEKRVETRAPASYLESEHCTQAVRCGGT